MQKQYIDGCRFPKLSSTKSQKKKKAVWGMGAIGVKRWMMCCCSREIKCGLTLANFRILSALPIPSSTFKWAKTKRREWQESHGAAVTAKDNLEHSGQKNQQVWRTSGLPSQPPLFPSYCIMPSGSSSTICVSEAARGGDHWTDRLVVCPTWIP